MHLQKQHNVWLDNYINLQQYILQNICRKLNVIT